MSTWEEGIAIQAGVQLHVHNKLACGTGHTLAGRVLIVFSAFASVVGGGVAHKRVHGELLQRGCMGQGGVRHAVVQEAAQQ